MRTASEMNIETKAIIEDFVNRKIDEASENKCYSVDFDIHDVPAWLCIKLSDHGYILTEAEGSGLVTVSWEQPRDVE